MMGRALFRLGRYCAAHPRHIVLAWIVLAVGLTFAVHTVGSMTSNDLTLPGTQSQEASDLLAANFPPQQNGSSPIVFHVRTGEITTGANKNAVEASYQALARAPHVYSATDPFGKSAPVLTSADHRTIFIPVLLKISNGQVTEDLAQHIFDATAPAQKQGIEVAAGGTIGSALSPSPTESSEVVGLLTAMLILALTFGSFIAMGLPILTAVLGLATALGIIGLLTHVFTVPVVGPTLAIMIGLGVGIDYSLFLVHKYREYLADGLDRHEAIARAVATSGSAIVFAGTTVMIALVSLVVAGIPLVATLGYVTAIAVLTAVLAAITLLPSVISLLGSHVFGARLPAFLRPRKKPAGAGGWDRWAATVTRHRWVCTLIALAILAPLIVPVFSLNLGQEDIGVTPQSTTERQAFDLMSQAFGPGYNGPLLIAVELSPPAAESQQYADQYAQAKALQSDLQDKQQSLSEQADSLTAQQAALQQQQQQLEAQKGNLTQQQQALLAQKEQLLAAESRLLSQEQALRDKQAQLEQEKAALQQQRDVLAQEIRAALIQRARLTVKLRVILGLEARIEAQLAAHDCASQPSQPPCPALELALQRAQAAEAATRAALAANAAQLQRLEQQAAQLAREAQQLLAQAAALHRQASQLQAQGAALQAQADALQVQGASLQAQADALQAQGASLQAQASSLQAQGDSLKAQQQQAENEQKQALALQQQLTDELTYAGGDDRGTDPRLVKLQNALSTPAGVLKVSPPTINKKGNAVTFNVIPTTRPAATETANLVRQLRMSVIPRATQSAGITTTVVIRPAGTSAGTPAGTSAGTPAASSPANGPAQPSIVAYVGGVTAGNVDLASKISSKLALVIAVVLALSFLLLMVAFRSLLIPLQAAITNLLCVGAAFGVLTATFQWGWGLHLIGLPSPYGTVPIASYVPLMMFAALFGLSMDYEVFLVSQIAQRHAAGEEPRQAVRSGLAAAARVIAAAAIIMIAVFGSFIINPDPTIKQFGVGLSVAVLLAGTMVLLLAPALLALFGARTWVLPRWLARAIPHVDVEGESIAFEPAPAQAPQPETTAPGVGPGSHPGVVRLPATTAPVTPADGHGSASPDRVPLEGDQ
jgi:uncharacterized membrane protein YdfJ with MMPL/SSD domain